MKKPEEKQKNSKDSKQSHPIAKLLNFSLNAFKRRLKENQSPKSK
jgi:hypothetical protein